MKRKEPMFNLAEPSLMMFIGLLIVIHVATLMPIVRGFLYQYWVLVPMETNYYPVTGSRQAISLFGHGFLHAGFNHLLMNAASILIFGVITFQGVRALFGRGFKGLTRFWLLYFIGVIGGGLMQWAWWAAIDAQSASALGASGGASALFAAAGWAIGGRKRLVLFGLAFILLNVLMVLFSGGIAWAAHLGGFVAGALMAVYWVKPFGAEASIFR